MTMLIVGVLMWSLIHLVPSILPGLRSAAVARIGEGGFKGVFALGVLASIVLMVFGWMEADQYPVYMPPSWGASASMVIILVAFVLMGLAHAQSNIKRFIRHPQLTGLALWSIGHLLSNGDNLSLILFGWLGLWAVLEILLISMREGDWQRPEPLPFSAEIKPLIIGLVVFAVFLGVHPWLFGVSPLPF